MSIYTVATLGEPDNQITFNDYAASPVYRQKTRAPQSFQVRDNNLPIPFESGISDFNTFIGQTMYIIQGTMYPKDELTYEAGIAALRLACSLDTQQSDVAYTDDGYVPYTWGEASGSKTLFVKALYVHLTEDTRQGYVQPFVIYCKIKDPIIWGSTLKIASTAGYSPTTTTGAANYSLKYPIAYGSTLYTVSSTATNNGDLPSYPFSIDVYGPVSNPKILNATTGKYIKVNTTLSTSADVLHLNYGKDSLVVTKNGNSAMSSIDATSTYFKLIPGDNVIQLSGSSVGTGGYCVVTYRDSSALA